MEKDRLKDENQKVITSKKIRIYPENEDLYFNALHLHRRAYNLTIEAFKNGINPSSELRSKISLQCKKEFSVFNTNLIQEAYRKACTTRVAIIRKRKLKQKCDYSFMSWKNSTRYFLVNKLGKKGTIYTKSLGNLICSEEIPDEAILKSAIVTYNHGQWFVSVQYFNAIAQIRTSNTRKIVAIDPGVRTFATTYSQTKSIKYGHDFVNEKLVPIMLRLDDLLSQLDLVKNHKAKYSKDEAIPQWISNRIKSLTKQLDNARAKQFNLVNDLHKRVAFDLVMNNEIILLPTFETQKMSKKSDELNKRKIRKKTVRSMLSLAHYKFKVYIKWLAKKYGKIVIDVNEAYTSKTLWDGSIKNNLGGSKLITHNGIQVDRDIHGARNILIRFLTIFSSL